eukprot:CAMPEP_0177576492 /NCGR_PEP_ID=MMETSP0369-20130122/80154_1 /TAXON_ID=447022 ORGANISM="Scrippsiella hangoei-like, Strain SHHI-4" /NCGR_SAMPLE_ID=MMETSP0369 /ASSEMBLY_ACC=CAM_ASM_000364 /LENGTH=163 /DNA_ID=CAMNT_0019064803 /DNA_START=139 /DNA_END=627 /DNA_ORIENTATION=+
MVVFQARADEMLAVVMANDARKQESVNDFQRIRGTNLDNRSRLPACKTTLATHKQQPAALTGINRDLGVLPQCTNWPTPPLSLPSGIGRTQRQPRVPHQLASGSGEQESVHRTVGALRQRCDCWPSELVRSNKLVCEPLAQSTVCRMPFLSLTSACGMHLRSE